MFANVCLATAIGLNAMSVSAEQGAPHSLVVSPMFSNLNIKWSAPQNIKELRWHNNESYNGEGGLIKDPQGTAIIYASSVWDANDLKNHVGETLESVTYYQYYPAISATVIVYENEVPVVKQPADMSKFEKDTWNKVVLEKPYVIKAGVDVRIAVKYVHGRNLQFVAMTDKVPHPKGNFRSYDGKKWEHSSTGTYMLTANFKNTVDEVPTGYNVYVDDVKQNSELIADTMFTAANLANGMHKVVVGSVYGDKEYKSYVMEAATNSVDNLFPAVSSLSASVKKLTGTLFWTEPLVRTDKTMTWSNKTFGNSIGGTSASNPKVWIKNEFKPTDMVTFANTKISAVNFMFTEAVVTKVKIFVMKDDKIIYGETVPESVIQTIKAKEWVKFRLTTPVPVETGSTFAYGLLCYHEASKKPISVDTNEGLNWKGNVFSTSSENSSNFVNSKPSWKTLTQGHIAGNWMMTADLETEEAAPDAKAASYNVYRDGTQIAKNIKAFEYVDEVDNPGLYKYEIEAIGSNGKHSLKIAKNVNYELPSEFRAPNLGNTSFNKETGEVGLEWNMDVQLTHCGDVKYIVGFDEDMEMMYGAHFTAEELKPYEGYDVKNLIFAIGDSIGSDLKLQIFNDKGDLLTADTIAAKDLVVQAIYTLPLTKPIKVDASEGLYLVYNTILPAGKSPIIIDGGPLKEGGAMVSMTAGKNWMKLGTINSTYNNYNIFIGMGVSMPSENAQPSEVQYIGSMPLLKGTPEAIEIKAETSAKPKAADLSSKVIGYDIYRNYERIATTTETTYNDALDQFGSFKYFVVAKYSNGWDSPESESIIINNPIAQKGSAPYNLVGEVAKEGEKTNLKLIWKAADRAPVLSYETGDLSHGLGMTASGSTMETYAVNLFPADSLVKHVGKLITHVTFGVYSTEITTADVVIFDGKGILYQQSVPVESLVEITQGTNVVRLNNPVKIEAGKEYRIGYYMTYPKGSKPLLCDAGPAVDGFGNLISSTASGTSTAWKTLKKLNSQLDFNWRINATLQEPNSVLKTENTVTYNVYCNDKLVKSDITGTTATIEDAVTGYYSVTEVKNGVETANSNTVYIETANSGVEEIAANAVAFYNEATETVVMNEVSSAKVYNANGNLVKVVENANTINMKDLAPGMYIVSINDDAKLKLIK